MQDEQELIILRQRYADLEMKYTSLQSNFEKKGDLHAKSDDVCK